MLVKVSVRELHVSQTSIHRILKENLEYRSYNKRFQLFLTDAHKTERKVLANWVRTNFRKVQTIFPNEKNFDIDEVDNLQNDRVWISNYSAANERGKMAEKRKLTQNVMVWLGVCSSGISSLVISEQGILDHARYIKEVLSVALKYGNEVFTFQQDGTTLLG